MRPTRLPYLLVSIAAIGLVAAAAAPAYRVTGAIPGPDGGWDYAAVDATTHMLYVAHGSAAMAVDLAHGNAVRSLGTIARAHAVVPIPGKNLLLVSSAQDDSVRLLDTADGHEVANIAVGKDPDAAFYDAASGRAVVMNAKGGTVSVIDVAARQVVGTITLKPGLEFGVMGEGKTLFVNNEDENEIETADLATRKPGAAIAMPGCEGPTGLGYDAATHQLISACANGKAVVIDARTRRLVRLIDIGKGPDAVIMDTARRLAFIPCGRDGTISVVALDGAGGAQVTGTITSEIGARTGALDSATGTLYLPAARFGPPASPGGRPVAVPGTFHIVVVGRE
ncbi:MAG: gluconolactonase [Sphingomonas sp. 28-66-16]|nr:MAG: gluconolactonase [Sphingomonas sp. 28-66-16]